MAPVPPPLSDDELFESITGFFALIGGTVTGGLRQPVAGAAWGAPKMVTDADGIPVDVDTARAEHNARVLIKASQSRPFIRRALVAIHKMMSDGEVVAVAGQIGIAHLVDMNMVKLDSQVVMLTGLAPLIPAEVWEQARAEAQAQEQPSATDPGAVAVA